MINEFIERIIRPRPGAHRRRPVQEVEIHLRFIGRLELPVTELSEEEIKARSFCEERTHPQPGALSEAESGERTVGVPVTLTCKCCGQEFASKRTNTQFCGPNCRSKFYRRRRQRAAAGSVTCENCGRVFTTTRADVKYCGDDCRYQAQIKRQGARKKALREAKNEKERKQHKIKTQTCGLP